MQEADVALTYTCGETGGRRDHLNLVREGKQLLHALHVIAAASDTAVVGLGIKSSYGTVGVSSVFKVQICCDGLLPDTVHRRLHGFGPQRRRIAADGRLLIERLGQRGLCQAQGRCLVELLSSLVYRNWSE